ncbi:HAD family hydrolase [Mammaliicoccus sciuri]|uniref:HAD family hydrolase n=1 Tax=Mammaliicoccus sciuri TaxID=1296 RepID=UPI001E4A568F|nr:HAD family hydrolase [Mammaliicoccus sciuri]MCD8895387.1 HAD family hydrolase [Mammaliicoccus sciuri]
MNYSEVDLSIEQIKDAMLEEINPKYFLLVGDKFDRLYSLSNRYFINLESKNLGNDFIDKVKRYQISPLENIHIYIDKYFRKVSMDPYIHKFLKNEPIIIKNMYIKKKNNNYILEFESNGLDALSKQITGNKGGKNNNVIDSLLFSEIELQNIVNKNVSKGITINKVIKDLNLSLKHVKVEVPYIYFGQDMSQTSFQMVKKE